MKTAKTVARYSLLATDLGLLLLRHAAQDGRWFRVALASGAGAGQHLNGRAFVAGEPLGHESGLAEPGLALGAIVAVDVWKTTPFMALLLLSGLTLVPAEPPALRMPTD